MNIEKMNELVKYFANMDESKFRTTLNSINCDPETKTIIGYMVTYAKLSKEKDICVL